MKFKKLFMLSSLCLIMSISFGLKTFAETKEEIAAEKDIQLVGTRENLLKLLKESLSAREAITLDAPLAGGGVVTTEPSEPKTKESIVTDSTGSSSGSTSNADFSSTNIQVQGVDEADIIKTDGKYIYYVSANKIVIVDATNPSDLKVVNTIKYDDNEYFSASELYLDKGTLTVIGNSYNNDNVKAQPYVKSIFYTNNFRTHVRVYNIEKITDIKESRKFFIDGNYMSSRKIENNIYLITNNYMNYYKDMNVSDIILPSYSDSVKSAESKISFDSMYYFPGTDSTQYINISSIDIKDNKKEAIVQTYIGASNNIYASTTNLYTAISQYGFNTVDSPAIDNTSSTIIYKFALDKGKVAYKSKGKVPGDILNQFSMDEYKGTFRIATTATNWTVSNSLSKNNVYFLDESMSTLGKLENLAKGERIYSTRFMGNRIYMVTFKNIDPLFVIDGTDPKNPVVLGELKIPGYSTYLHPYDENHLIGFGNDTIIQTGDIEGEEFTRDDGMKISLFDVTDVKKPKEMFTEKIGDAGTYSDVLYNHKALMFSKEKNLIAFPINIVKNTTEKIDGFDYYGSLNFSGAIVYNVDLKNGFELKGQISNFENQKDFREYNNVINRIIYIKDALYTFSNTKAKATDLNSFKGLSSVIFK